MGDLAATLAAAVLLPLIVWALPLFLLSLVTACLTALDFESAACLWYALGTLALAFGD